MTEVKRYAVRIHGGPAGMGKGIRASIHLFDKDKKLVGNLSFVESGETIKKDAEKDGKIEMYLPASQLTNVVDILRNERPIYIDWQEKLKNAYLGTAQEPVGEGEQIGFTR